MRCVCSIVEQFSVFTSFLLVLEFELLQRTLVNRYIGGNFLFSQKNEKKICFELYL